jgi:hypothetical protein
MSTLGKLFFSLIKELGNEWSHLNRWLEKQSYLIEIEAVTLNGPPDGWTYPKRVMPTSHS